MCINFEVVLKFQKISVALSANREVSNRQAKLGSSVGRTRDIDTAAQKKLIGKTMA